LSNAENAVSGTAQQWLANGLRDWAQRIFYWAKIISWGSRSRPKALSRLLTRGSRGLSRTAITFGLLLVLESWLRVWKAELSTKPVEQVETIPLKSNALRPAWPRYDYRFPTLDSVGLDYNQLRPITGRTQRSYELRLIRTAVGILLR